MMKKLLPLILVLLLLLAGCGGKETTEPSDATEKATQAEQKGLYDPESTVEQQTAGAVRVYRLNQNGYFGICPMGSRLLLLAEDGMLTVLQGENGVPAASASTELAQTEQLRYDASVQGAAYYEPETRQVVLVNPQLQQTNRTTMPEDMQGLPYISMAKEEVYYCIPGEIRALNLQTGVSRLIRSHAYPDQSLAGIWFDGDMLQVSFRQADGTAIATEYISAETGKTLHTAQEPFAPFYTGADSYVLGRTDGGVSQMITGSREGTAQTLALPEEQIISALAMDGMIGYTEEKNLYLSFYSVTSGLCTARVTLPGVTDLKTLIATEETVWLLAYENGKQILCRWDPAASPVKEDTAYTGKLFTAAEPDLEGLETCKEQAAQLGETYGIQIHVWDEAIQNMTEESETVPEYQVLATGRMLEELEQALTRLPEGFLRKTVEDGKIHVNLVRSSQETALQYWQEGDCYITVVNEGSAAAQFYRGVAYAIDSRVLGNSRKFDDWNDLNPEGFSYSYSYGPHPEQETYLGGENSAFLTEKAMAYPQDDRAEVFCYAMMADNAQYFAGSAMQAKLEVMCRAIREAYRLEKSPDVYPWEQYLTESLT